MGKKIDQLPAAGALTGAEAFPLMQNDTTRHSVVSAILTYFLSTITTPPPGDSDTSPATTAFVQAVANQLRNGVGGALDTLDELAAALNDDPNFAATITTALAGKAPLNSPALTGSPTAPTPAAGAVGTELATAAWVLARIAAVVNSSPSTLDTLNELAAALGNDPNFATTITTALGNRLRFDAAQSLTATQKAQGAANLGVAAFAPGYFRGLGIANNAADAVNDVDVATGAALADDGATLLTLAAGLTKRLDATFAQGTGQGMLDSGAKANSTTYHLWLIHKTADGAIDVLASTSPTAPTMPSGWLAKRYLWPIMTDSGGTIRPFSQFENEFLWSTPYGDVFVTNPGTAAALRTLTVPTGIKVRANLATGGQGNPDGRVYVSSPDQPDTAPGTANFNSGATVTAVQGFNPIRVRTNTAGQIRTRNNASDGSTVLLVSTHGFDFYRGAY